MGLLIYLYSYRLHEGALNIHNTICVHKWTSEQYSDRTCCKEKLGKCWRTFTSHVYLENTHFKSLWSIIYQYFTNNVVLCLSYI